MGSADPLEKMDEKLKSENMQKTSFLNGGGVGVNVIRGQVIYTTQRRQFVYDTCDNGSRLDR